MTSHHDGPIGIASGTLVNTVLGSGNEKQTEIEKISNRYNVTNFDLEQGKKLCPKIKQRIEHTGANLLALGFIPDRWRGAEFEKLTVVLVLSEFQQVWASKGRNTPAEWITAKNLLPGQHVLKLGYTHESGSYGEVLWINPPKWANWQNVAVHELVLVDSDSYLVSDVLCRTSFVPASPMVKKRLVYPLKDFPIINFVPQPKTLSLAQAEIWYRKSSTILPRCLSESAQPLDQVRAMWELKHRLRTVASKSLIETTLSGEFISKHPLPTLEDLIPTGEHLRPQDLARLAEEAVRTLESPGDRRYSEFTGGIESQRVWSETGYWEFDGQQWVLATGK